jgi:hypothetical protein
MPLSLVIKKAAGALWGLRAESRISDEVARGQDWKIQGASLQNGVSLPRS